MIESSSPVPIYLQVANWMRSKIDTGEWPEHYRIKGELILAEELQINRGTLRKAIQKLIGEGFLISVQGRGTFVAARTLEEDLAERLVALSEVLEQQGVPLETRAFPSGIISPPLHVASLLSLGAGGKVFAMKRLRATEGVPFVFEKNYVVARFCPRIETVDFSQNSLFKTLETKFGLELSWGRRTFQAQLAEGEIAENLYIPVGSPIMYIQQISYLNGDTPIECSDIWMRGDRIRFSTIVSRTSGSSEENQTWTYTINSQQD